MLLRLISGITRLAFVLMVAIISIAAGGYIAILTYQAIFYIPNVTVPSVLNMEINAAQQELHQSGLKMMIVDEPVLGDSSNWFVISQKPLPGAEIKKNRTIEVEIRDIRISNQIPNLIGKTLQEAENLLVESNYTIGNIAYSMHHQIATGRIIAQTPNAGEISADNIEISVLVSKGVY